MVAPPQQDYVDALQPGTVILRAGPQLQRPQWRQSSWVTGLSQSDTRNLLEQTQLGISGYDPEEADMRGVFMARGPGFQKDQPSPYPAIELVDVYQIFCHLESVLKLCFPLKFSLLRNLTY